jgi:putative Mn2+ efflux pump MntP
LKEDDMTRLFTYAGIAASVILIAFGVGAIYTGFDGRDQVRGDLAREQIVGTDDSTIPGQAVDTGSEAQAFAAVIRKHTLEATGGQTYSQMGRFLDDNGKATSDEKLAATDPKTGQPVENGLREMWVTSTALSTSLNTAYFAERVATFAIVMGFALLLTGIGFLVLTARLLVPRTARQIAPIEKAADPVPA